MHTEFEKEQRRQLILQELEQVFTKIPFNRMLGLTLTHVDLENVTMEFAMRDELIGNYLHQILHGGVISSVLDMVGGMAVMIGAIYKHPTCNSDEIKKTLSKASTIDLQISFLKPGKGEFFVAKSWITHSGNKITFTRMELFNHEQALIATGSGTYFIS
jgi:uncharacterized protein (TIGR00369 family)